MLIREFEYIIRAKQIRIISLVSPHVIIPIDSCRYRCVMNCCEISQKSHSSSIENVPRISKRVVVVLRFSPAPRK